MAEFGADTILESDPAAEFLAREQNELVGLEDDLNASLCPIVENLTLDESNLPDFDKTEEELEKGSGDDEVAENDLSDEMMYKYNESVMVKLVESEKIKKWREDNKIMLEEKDEKEKKEKEKLRLNAEKELEDWYKQYEESASKRKPHSASSSEQSGAGDADNDSNTEWKRIADLCDFQNKSSHNVKDISRMKSIILQLKQAAPKSI